MEKGTSSRGVAESARTTAVGTAISIYAVFDSLIACRSPVLAAVLNPLIVLAAAAASSRC